MTMLKHSFTPDEIDQIVIVCRDALEAYQRYFGCYCEDCESAKVAILAEIVDGLGVDVDAVLREIASDVQPEDTSATEVLPL